MGRGRKTIVAGVSELGAHDLSLRVALELGRRSGATVHLVHAFDLQPLAWPAGMEPAYDDRWDRLPAELLAALEEAARPLGPEASTHCQVVPGTAGHALTAVAADVRADLIVVGSAHAGRVRQAFLGTTAQRVLHAAHVPVLVVRRPVSAVPPRVLLATDLSPLAASVHDRALDVVATFLGPRCGALRSLVVASFGRVSPPVPAAALARAVCGELERFLMSRRPRLGRVEPAVRLGSAVPAEVFAEAAGWRADLLVVGTHARHAFEALALGGTAEACIRDAPCNVLAVPPACPAVITLEAAAPAAAMAGASA